MSATAPALIGLPFTEMYRRHSREIIGYCVRATGDLAAGQDLASETFFRAMQASSSYVDRGRPVRAWLVAIARNLVRDHVRSAYQRRTVLLAREEMAELVPAVDDPERSVLQADAATRVRAALRELTAVQRECVFLRFIAGMSVAETAAVLHRKETAIRAIQHRAIVKLRRLADDGEFGLREFSDAEPALAG